VAAPATWLAGAAGGRGGRCRLTRAPLHNDPTFDAADRAHQGSAAFRRFIERYRPPYWLHGHNHLLTSWVPRVSRIADTVVINTYGHYLLDTGAPLPVVPIKAEPSALLRPS